MRTYRTVLIGVGMCLLLPCTSCQLSDLDANGDGTITRDEIVSAIVDAVCGGSDGSSTSDGTTTDGTDNGSSSDNQNGSTTDDGSSQ